MLNCVYPCISPRRSTGSLLLPSLPALKSVLSTVASLSSRNLSQDGTTLVSKSPASLPPFTLMPKEDLTVWGGILPSFPFLSYFLLLSSFPLLHCALFHSLWFQEHSQDGSNSHISFFLLLVALFRMYTLIPTKWCYLDNFPLITLRICV